MFYKLHSFSNPKDMLVQNDFSLRWYCCFESAYNPLESRFYWPELKMSFCIAISINTRLLRRSALHAQLPGTPLAGDPLLHMAPELNKHSIASACTACIPSKTHTHIICSRPGSLRSCSARGLKTGALSLSLAGALKLVSSSRVIVLQGDGHVHGIISKWEHNMTQLQQRTSQSFILFIELYCGKYFPVFLLTLYREAGNGNCLYFLAEGRTRSFITINAYS
jgi:hypothetical protein